MIQGKPIKGIGKVLHFYPDGDYMIYTIHNIYTDNKTHWVVILRLV